MSASSLNPAPSIGAPVSPFTQSTLYRFVLFPLGQMVVFIVVATIILTALSFVLALIAPLPAAGAPPLERLTRQLPGTIFNGIGIGFLYAMIALGYTLVYGVLKFINFAHSEIFMVGGVIAYIVMTAMRDAEALQSWNPILLIMTVLLCSMLTSGLLAVTIERVAYRPLRNAPRLVPLITAIGISFVLIDFVRGTLAVTRNEFNLRFPTDQLEWLKPIKVAFSEDVTVNFRASYVVVIIAAVLMLLALNYFVNGTKLGRGVRAVSQDPTMAGLLGVNVNLMITLTFFLGGAFGGAAGALFGMNAGTITPYVGFIPGLKAFTAAVLGGIGNMTGALLGGLTIGLIEQFLNGVLPLFPALGTGWTDVFVFAILILILLFRPSGLLGEKVDEKV